jgi:hypothetical protein
LSSLSACLAPTSPTKARLSGIHIATSRNAMPPPESASRALGTTPQATHPDLLKRALSVRCRTLAAMPEIIQAETRFGWWPATAVAN